MPRLFIFLLGIAVVTSSAQTSGRKPLPEWMRDPQNTVFYAPTPVYSAFARAHHLRGDGMFLLHLRADGTVRSVEITQSTGHAELDQACLSAFSQWRFKPKLVHTTQKVKIPVSF